MSERNDTARAAGNSPAPRPLYPAGIAYFIEERPLLWYEDAAEYDQLRQEIFAELAPEGALHCIFVKNVVDYLWELRRMKKLKQTAINFFMPDAAAPLLAPSSGLWGNPDKAKVREHAADVAFGAEEEVGKRAADLRRLSDYERRAHSTRRKAFRRLDYEKVEAERKRVTVEARSRQAARAQRSQE